MKSNVKITLMAVVLIMGSTQLLVAQRATTIESINSSPSNFNGVSVEIRGTVVQWVRGEGSTSYFMIEDEFKNKIKVNTSLSAPDTYKKYRIQGIVYLDAYSRPFVSEQQNRELLESAPNKVDLTTPPSEPLEEPKPSWTTIVLICIGLVALVLVILLVRKRKPAVESVRSPESTQTFERSVYTEPSQSGQGLIEEFKTIRFSNEGAPKTMKFIPGRLDIISGADQGKSFRIAGYPTADGDIVTLGRAVVKGDRVFAHIQIDQKFKTVSREQLKLIYRGGQLYVCNLSQVNPTQLDGAELGQNETKLLNPGSVIRTGELEFVYKV